MKLNGITYNSNNIRLVNLLENIRNSDVRVTLHYGDPTTGREWGDSVTGYVRNSTGNIKVPAIIHNKTSTSGTAILDRCIVKMEYANKKEGGLMFHIKDIPVEQPSDEHSPDGAPVGQNDDIDKLVNFVLEEETGAGVTKDVEATKDGTADVEQSTNDVPNVWATQKLLDPILGPDA